LSLWTFNEAAEPATAGYGICRATVNYAGEELSFWVEGGEEEILKRAIGCAMIIGMPDECIEEAVGCLKDILEFCSETQYLLPQVARTSPRLGRITGISSEPGLLIEG
jgi:hypothetical protein